MTSNADHVRTALTDTIGVIEYQLRRWTLDQNRGTDPGARPDMWHTLLVDLDIVLDRLTQLRALAVDQHVRPNHHRLTKPS